MKKILTFAMVFISFISYGQEAQRIPKIPSLNLKQKQRPSFDLILYYGTTKKFGIEFNYNTKTNLVWGFGLSAGLSGGNGVAFRENTVPDGFRDNIYEIKVKDYRGLYGTFGYAFDKLKIGAKFGYGSSRKYFNSYVNAFTSQYAGSKVLSGVFISYKLKSEASPYFGYDNFNGANLGISCRF